MTATLLITAGIACLLLSAVASWMDRRQGNRSDLDRVSPVSWPLILVLALVGAAMMALLVVAAL